MNKLGYDDKLFSFKSRLFGFSIYTTETVDLKIGNNLKENMEIKALIEILINGG